MWVEVNAESVWIGVNEESVWVEVHVWLAVNIVSMSVPVNGVHVVTMADGVCATE